MTEVAQASGRIPLESMAVDACRLRRHVGAHAHEPAGKLVGQLEGLQVEVVARTRKQGL